MSARTESRKNPLSLADPGEARSQSLADPGDCSRHATARSQREPLAAVQGIASAWHRLPRNQRQGFREVWRIKVTHPSGHQALWLRFSVLSSANGFRKALETWAVHFSRSENGEITKTALKQVHEIGAFFEEQSLSGNATLRFGVCELTPTSIRGSVQAKGKTLRWDLAISSAQQSDFNWIPEGFSRMARSTGRAFTLGEDLRFTGAVEVDDSKSLWNAAPGALSHHAGPRYWNSWAWAHCNTFENEQGQPVYCLFEGFSGSGKLLGLMPSPRVSSFYLFYRDEHFRLNTLWDSLRTRSEVGLSQWRFQAETGDIRFTGEITAEHRDFAGFTYEDTNGSLLYCSNAELARMTLNVYRRGKLEASLRSRGTTAFEVASRKRNPYVPILI